jgi:hypothetical protein
MSYKQPFTVGKRLYNISYCRASSRQRCGAFPVGPKLEESRGEERRGEERRGEERRGEERRGTRA